MKGEEILKEIFQEAEEAKDKARRLAEQKFPTLLSLNKAYEYSKHIEEIEKQLLKELRIKYEITEEQLDAIKREGILKGWSRPSKE